MHVGQRIGDLREVPPDHRLAQRLRGLRRRLDQTSHVAVRSLRRGMGEE